MAAIFDSISRKARFIYIFGVAALIFTIMTAGSEAKSWKHYYNIGLREFNEENYEEAEMDLEKALKRNARLYQALNILAEISLIKNDRDQAINYFKQSIIINDHQPEIHCKLGNLYDFFMKNEKAYDHYSRSIAIDPGFAKGHVNLIIYYTRKNDFKRADKHFNICNSYGKAEGEKYYYLALKEIELKNDEKAIGNLELALEKNPVMVDASFALSEIYRRKKDYMKAVQYLEMIRELRPDYKNVNLYLGHLYFTHGLSLSPGRSGNIKLRKNILEKAGLNFETAIRIDPRNSELYTLLAQVYVYLGKNDEAEEIMRQAASLE